MKNEYKFLENMNRETVKNIIASMICFHKHEINSYELHHDREIISDHISFIISCLIAQHIDDCVESELPRIFFRNLSDNCTMKQALEAVDKIFDLYSEEDSGKKPDELPTIPENAVITEWQTGVAKPDDWPLCKEQGHPDFTCRGRETKEYQFTGEMDGEYYLFQNIDGNIERFAYHSDQSCQGWHLRIDGIDGEFEFCSTFSTGE